MEGHHVVRIFHADTRLPENEQLDMPTNCKPFAAWREGHFIVIVTREWVRDQ